MRVRITILVPKAIESLACGCYAVARHEDGPNQIRTLVSTAFRALGHRPPRCNPRQSTKTTFAGIREAPRGVPLWVVLPELRLVAENHLIELLPRAERLRVLAICEPFDLVLSQTLFDMGATTRHVYFPTNGFVSLLASVDEVSLLEVGMVGREGMLGVHVALGSLRSPLKALVQGPGTAWRIPIGPFKRELALSTALQRGLNRYIAVLMSQLASSSACVRYHQIGPRLARWLLMSQDRTGGDRFFMTQQSLSSMLGVRRVGVTSAAGNLQRQGLIDYHRGEIHVLDRPGLEAASCSCYATDQLAYASLAQ